MVGVFSRILLRVIAGILIGRGVSMDIVNIFEDPDLAVGLEALIGGAIWTGTEFFYYLAKRLNWET